MNTGRGNMSPEKALEYFKVKIKGDDYPFLICVFRKLSGRLKQAAADMVLDEAVKNPEKFLTAPYPNLYREALRIQGPPTLTGYKFVTQSRSDPKDWLSQRLFRRNHIVLISLWNTGKHLYASDQSEYGYANTFVPFRRFSGCGAKFGRVHLQHLGHLHGVDGGSAEVTVHAGLWTWNIILQPKQGYCLVEYRDTQYLFTR